MIEMSLQEFLLVHSLTLLNAGLFFMDYKEQYKHPKWQKKRLEILERDDFTCQRCLNKNDELHVHHHYYERNKNVWEYPNQCLVSLCKDCHKEIEKIKLDFLKEMTVYGLDLWFYIAEVGGAEIIHDNYIEEQKQIKIFLKKRRENGK